jgi:flagellar biosynthesis/type III secretory pathway protein FliH
MKHSWFDEKIDERISEARREAYEEGFCKGHEENSKEQYMKAFKEGAPVSVPISKLPLSVGSYFECNTTTLAIKINAIIDAVNELKAKK